MAKFLVQHCLPNDYLCTHNDHYTLAGTRLKDVDSPQARGGRQASEKQSALRAVFGDAGRLP